MKDLKKAPLMQFITTPEAQPAANPSTRARKIQEDTAAIDDEKTTRSRRVQLLFRPGLHAALVRLAEKDGISLNRLVEKALLDYAVKRGAGMQ